MAKYGKVLRIFDETSILINLGLADGLKRGDLIVVIEKGEEVKDPNSGDSLGVLELVKAELVLSDVQERISIAKTRTEADEASGLPLSARMVRDSVKDVGRQPRMTISPGEITGRPSPSPVRTGDAVRVLT